MLRSYVGLISHRGLETLWPESKETYHFLARRLPRELTRGNLGYWAVLDDETVGEIRQFMTRRQHVVALRLVQLQAAHFGTIWPETLDVERAAWQYFPKI